MTGSPTFSEVSTSRWLPTKFATRLTAVIPKIASFFHRWCVLATWKRVIHKIEFGWELILSIQIRCFVKRKKICIFFLFFYFCVMYTHRRPWFLSGRLWWPAVHRQWWDCRPLRHCLLGRRMRFSFLSWYVWYTMRNGIMYTNDSQVNSGILIATLAISPFRHIFFFMNYFEITVNLCGIKMY